MKRNTVPEIVVDFTRLVGHARKVLMHNVQKNLFKMGYKWAGNGDNCVSPQHLDARALVINMDYGPLNLAYIGRTEELPRTTNTLVVISALTQLDYLFEQAKTIVAVETCPNHGVESAPKNELSELVEALGGKEFVIDGVPVIISEGFICGLSVGKTAEQVKEVQRKATLKYKELFGDGSGSVKFSC